MAGAKQEVVQVHTEFYKRFVFAKTEIFMKTLRMYDEQVQPFVYIFSLSDVTMWRISAVVSALWSFSLDAEVDYLSMKSGAPRQHLGKTIRSRLPRPVESRPRGDSSAQGEPFPIYWAPSPAVVSLFLSTLSQNFSLQEPHLSEWILQKLHHCGEWNFFFSNHREHKKIPHFLKNFQRDMTCSAKEPKHSEVCREATCHDSYA